MKRIAILATVLSSAIMPTTAVGAASAGVAPKQAVCVPVIVDAGEGPVEGVLCYTQGGRV